jgi:hypothetical protein
VHAEVALFSLSVSAFCACPCSVLCGRELCVVVGFCVVRCGLRWLPSCSAVHACAHTDRVAGLQKLVQDKDCPQLGHKGAPTLSTMTLPVAQCDVVPAVLLAPHFAGCVCCCWGSRESCLLPSRCVRWLCCRRVQVRVVRHRAEPVAVPHLRRAGLPAQAVRRRRQVRSVPPLPFGM